MGNVRTFYETAYHFEEDAARPDPARLQHALQVANLSAETVHRFLDLGCGTGWLAVEALRTLRPEITVGLDFSRKALRLARQIAPSEIVWIHGDGLFLPFQAESFDVVFSFGSLEHFPDIPLALREIHRVLRNEGMLIAVVPNFYVRTEQPQEYRTTLGGWKRLFQDHGFRILRVGVDKGPRILKNWKPHRIALRLIIQVLNRIPGMAYQYILVTQKQSR